MRTRIIRANSCVFAVKTAFACSTRSRSLAYTAVVALLACGFVRNGKGDVRLSGVFSDHMVLQQDVAIPVWGAADDGEVVTVSFRNERVTVTADRGKWMVRLGRLKPGGPDRLIIEGKNRVEINDVLVGEVWICSGQSNMDFRMNRAYHSENAIASSANPLLRLFQVPKTKSDQPLDEVNAHWQVSGPDTVTEFSAVAYFFGRDLQDNLEVPIGLIQTSWGGSPAEVWMKESLVSASYPSIQDSYVELLKRYKTEKLKFDQEGGAADKPVPRVPWKPAELYNGMIHPLIPFAIRGAIWYQGESNVDRAQQYRSLLPDMIRNWRQDWNQGAFTFLLVQLAPWDKNKKRALEEIVAQPGDSDWAELREAQLLSTRILPKVGIVVITDVGEKDDIHPTRKEPVGNRLALAARAIAYNQKIVCSGPTLDKMRVRGSQVILSFKSVGQGLEARGSELHGFSVCGRDRKFVRAKAVIEGNKVIVSAPDVSNPIAVRYGWGDYPVVNLWNKDGLPASPFRTDKFPLTSK